MALCALTSALMLGGCSRKTSPHGGAGPRQVAASELRLSPDPAYAGSRIEAVFADPWIDPQKCRFEWRRDGSMIREARGKVLEPSRFSKGEEIAVRVFVEDPAGGPPRELRARVAVVNSPPKLTNAALVMSAAAGPAEVRAIVESTDPDGDPVSFEYRWFRNDAPIDGARDSSLAASGLARGDRLAVQVVATDRESSSPPFRSPPLQIDNLPPRISSQPVAPRANDVTFRYQVTAVDPDGDPLRFELVSAPPGMTLEPEGLVVWPLPSARERRGNHRVSIKVSDPQGGAAIQEFALNFDSPVSRL
jgi:hypothetical protein